MYGDVGRRGDVVVFSLDEDLKGDGVGVRLRMLGVMMWEMGRSFMESVIISVMMWVFVVVKKVFGVLKVNWVILVMLVVSLGYNLVSWG